MAITLRTVISELQFILDLSIESPFDSRLKLLVINAQKDLAALATTIGNDPLGDTNSP